MDGSRMELSKVITLEFPQKRRLTMYLGRNGYGWCSGIEVRPGPQWIKLNPINSKGIVTTSCNIEIPNASVIELIQEISKNFQENR